MIDPSPPTDQAARKASATKAKAFVFLGVLGCGTAAGMAFGNVALGALAGMALGALFGTAVATAMLKQAD
ncbi:MAG: hypothetical protein WCP53_12270 [Verrucomicrobiota bacterium]